jgi:hypothetical protein
MQLSISDRRRLTGLAGSDMSFRDRLETDPCGAVHYAIGRSFEAGKIELVHEADDWCFLMLEPAEIDAQLPEPYDVRSAVENDVYTLLRERPELREGAERDPKGFLSKEFGVEIDGDAGVQICREKPGTALIIIPNVSGREELSDDLLDLVSAGGSPGCQTSQVTSAPRDGS